MLQKIEERNRIGLRIAAVSVAKRQRQPIYCSYLKFSDLKASKPAVRKLGRRR
ncbi:MAG: hypothetical protein LBP59_06490 [Planctomycetaceae bacterium]|nr:hypothetical protein [Planctomycetaceae bacterium]